MNKPNSPWSIKGVSPAARDAAKEGARISRQPLGRWLSQVIRKTSADEGGKAEECGAAHLALAIGAADHRDDIWGKFLDPAQQGQ